jgi:hypothetical protein
VYNSKEEKNNLIGDILAMTGISKEFCSSVTVWDSFYRGEFLKSNEFYFDKDILYSDDLYYNILAFEKARQIIFVDYVGYHYWTNPDSITNKYTPELADRLENTLYNIKNNLINEGIFPYVEESLNCRIIQLILPLVRQLYFNKQNKDRYKVRKTKFKKLMNKDIFYNALYGKRKKMLSKFEMLVFLLKIPCYFPLEIRKYIKE